MLDHEKELNEKFRKLGYQEPDKESGPQMRFTSPKFFEYAKYLERRLLEGNISLQDLKQISNRVSDCLSDRNMGPEALDDVGQMMFVLERAASAYEPKSRKEKRLLKRIVTANNFGDWQYYDGEKRKPHRFEDDVIVDPVWSFAGHRLASRPFTQLPFWLGLGYLGGYTGAAEIAQLADASSVVGIFGSLFTVMGWSKVQEYLESKRTLKANSLRDFMDLVNNTTNSVVTLYPTSEKTGHFVEKKSEPIGLSGGSTYREFVHTGFHFFTLWKCEGSKKREIVFKTSGSNSKSGSFESGIREVERQQRQFPYMQFLVEGADGTQEYPYYLEKLTELEGLPPHQRNIETAKLSLARSGHCHYPETRFEICRV